MEYVAVYSPWALSYTSIIMIFPCEERKKLCDKKEFMRDMKMLWDTQMISRKAEINQLLQCARSSKRSISAKWVLRKSTHDRNYRNAISTSAFSHFNLTGNKCLLAIGWCTNETHEDSAMGTYDLLFDFKMRYGFWSFLILEYWYLVNNIINFSVAWIIF